MNGAAKGADNHLCRSEPVSVQITGKIQEISANSEFAHRMAPNSDGISKALPVAGTQHSWISQRRSSEPSRRHQALPSRPPRAQDSPQITGPNSTSTGVGVLTGVLNWSLPSAKSMWKTAILSVF